MKLIVVGPKGKMGKLITKIAAERDDLELVAVIAAAIAAYEGAGSTDGFVVRSIRKVNRTR